MLRQKVCYGFKGKGSSLPLPEGTWPSLDFQGTCSGSSPFTIGGRSWQ